MLKLSDLCEKDETLIIGVPRDSFVTRIINDVSPIALPESFYATLGSFIVSVVICCGLFHVVFRFFCSLPVFLRWVEEIIDSENANDGCVDVWTEWTIYSTFVSGLIFEHMMVPTLRLVSILINMAAKRPIIGIILGAISFLLFSIDSLLSLPIAIFSFFLLCPGLVFN